MSETVQDIESEDIPQAASSAGKMLSVAREAAGMSIEDAAARLRLSVYQVRALEADEASALPADTFVRGFIRNYAKLLGLDASPLLAAYRVSTPDSGAPTISLQSENILIVSHDRKTWRSYVVASVLVIVALGCWMIYMEYAVQDRPIAVAEKAATPKPVAAIPAMPTPPATPVLQAPLAAPAVPQVAAPESATTPTHPSATKLGMAFTEQSWVSVTEHDGKEIFNKNQPAGSQVTIDGNPPFSVVIGNATGVQLTYHDKPVDLEPHTRANVARLTLE